MIISSIKEGLYKSWKRPEIILLYLVLNLSIALLSMVPYLNAFQTFFAGSLVTNILSQDNIYTYYAEFYHYLKPAIDDAQKAFTFSGFLHFLITVVLTGGLITFLSTDEKVTWKRFFSASYQFLWCIIKLAILWIISFFAVFMTGLAITRPLSHLLPDIFAENVYFYLYFTWLLMIIVLIFFLFIIFDLGKVLLVKENSKSIFFVIRKSLILFMQNPLVLTSTYLLTSVLILISAVIFWIIQHYIADTHVWGILFGFILLQLFVYLQYWLKFARYGALVTFYESSV
jgi:hypothetical protein